MSLRDVGTVYHAFDTSNGMAYVGQTWYALDVRKKDHIKKSSDYVFGRALKKRVGAFVWNILCEVKSQEELDSAEDVFIKELKTLWPNGYNMKEGGRGGKPSEETRRKMSEKHKGRKLSKEHCDSISKSLMGHVPAKTVFKSGHISHMRGKKMSDEQKQKISQSHKGISIPHLEETRRRISESSKRAWATRRVIS